MIFTPVSQIWKCDLERLSELVKVIEEVIVKKHTFLSLRVNPLSLSFCSAVVREKELLSLLTPSLHIMDVLLS